MNIYTSESQLILFNAPYWGKQLLEDSVTRTLNGYQLISESSIPTGCGHILLARVESVAAGALVAVSSVIEVGASTLIGALCLVVVIPLNVASRIPGLSSFEFVQNSTQFCNDALYRALRINCIAIPVLFLFLTTSIVNTLLPGILGPQNILYRSIHGMVESLGPLQNIRATVPGVTTVVGAETKLSILDDAEEYLRALSPQNILREVQVPAVNHHYWS